MVKELTFSSSSKLELIDITSQIEEVVLNSKVEKGLCFISVPHATAAIILNENESGLKEDILKSFEKIVPPNSEYLHNQVDNNAQAHILSSILGQNKFLLVKDGRLIRGTWQNIFFVELDGPRSRRRVIIKVEKA
ncbi:MAG: YjbQ family protein [Candidatus Aenigmarchaeota archaeon]|nr:YjbQ family protein [Candidatus Aenigmarchaeota archaeon]